MVGLNWVTAWDRAVFVQINNHLRSPILDRIFPFISDLGLGHIQAFSILLAAVISGSNAGEFHTGITFGNTKQSIVSRKHWVYPLLLALLLSGVMSTIVKHSVVRDRPWGYYSKEHLLGRELTVHVAPPIRGPLKSHGFLSGHTATSFAIATTLAIIVHRRKRSIALSVTGVLVATLIGFSRIYVVDHWPLDVVAGAVTGVGCGYFAYYLCRNLVTPPDNPDEELVTI